MSVSRDALQQGLQRWLPPLPAAPPVEGPPPDPAPATAPTPPTAPVTAKPANLLDVAIAPEHLVAVAEYLRAQEFAMDTITGVDWLAAGEMEVIYDFYHCTSPLHVVVRTRVSREQPEVPTISRVFGGANWHERETHDFFGIRFAGHPDLSPLLLPEDATYHPLRKDFAGAA
jgi:NADH-quinone oxidoreductase subunit C